MTQMDFFSAMDISAGGLTAQRTRMSVVAENMANARTTRGAGGEPFRRGVVVLQSVPVERSDFAATLSRAMDDEPAHTVRVKAVTRDTRPPQLEYDPGHPDADAQGYVALPDVNVMTEMTDMITASRSYEANLTALRTLREMAQKALRMGR
jgi:flagellar basal-body rod protein FlgC